MKVKVRDIALKAGVSDGTVSNALNNRKGISEEKREYILKIAREMGYFKNNSSSNNNTIRLIIIYKDAHIIGDTPFFSELIRGIENECSLQGYELIIHHVNSDSLHTEITKSLKSNQTKGVLLLGTEMDIDDLKLFDNVCTPLVVLDNEYDYTYDRSTVRQKRKHNEIGISAVRGGTIVGEHDVIFAGTDEVIQISHTAYSKAIFAKGAIDAAKYIAGKEAGMYNMADVIG